MEVAVKGLPACPSVCCLSLFGLGLRLSSLIFFSQSLPKSVTHLEAEQQKAFTQTHTHTHTKHVSKCQTLKLLHKGTVAVGVPLVLQIRVAAKNTKHSGDIISSGGGVRVHQELCFSTVVWKDQGVKALTKRIWWKMEREKWAGCGE